MLCCVASIFHARSLSCAFRAVYVEFMNNAFPKSIQFGLKKRKMDNGNIQFSLALFRCADNVVGVRECSRTYSFLLIIQYSILFFYFNFFWAFVLFMLFWTKCRAFAQAHSLLFHALNLTIYRLFFIQISKVRVGPHFNQWVYAFVVSHSSERQNQIEIFISKDCLFDSSFLIRCSNFRWFFEFNIINNFCISNHSFLKANMMIIRSTTWFLLANVCACER